MGLSNGSGRRGTFVSVANGKFKVKSNADNPDAISRVNKKGDTVWEVPYSDLSGYITGIEITKFTFQGAENESLELTVQDGSDTYIVQCIFGSSPCKSFLARAENVDYTQEVTLSAFEYTQIVNNDERTNTYMVPKQLGENIPAIYGQEEKGLKPWPKLVEITRNRKTEWDKTDQLNEMEGIVARVKVILERDAKKSFVADKLPPSETRYDEPTKPRPEKKYDAVQDFGPAPTTPPAEEEDYNLDLPF